MNEELKSSMPELKIHNIGGMRWYEAPDGNKYPSITSVLSKRPDKQEGLQKWRKKIGEAQANIVSGKAARRGTAFHNICEDYLNGVEDITHHKDKNFLAYCMFGEMKSHLDDKIKEVVLQEQTMYSSKYKVAGRCDFIGVYNNTLAVVDFKTTTTPKQEEWIEERMRLHLEWHRKEELPRYRIFLIEVQKIFHPFSNLDIADKLSA